MPYMVCVRCQTKLKVEKNHVTVVETFGKNDDRPYKLWFADLWKCPECGIEVIAGFGQQRYAGHFEPDFAEKLAAANPKYLDKSC